MDDKSKCDNRFIQVCSCGKGYRSAYDNKCGHCRTRKERSRHRWLRSAQPAAPKQKTEVKLNINAERFLAAVDREGDHEIGVGLFAQPAEGEK